jgi:hypothetical protein
LIPESRKEDVPESQKGDVPESQKEMCLKVEKEKYRNKKLTAQLPLLREVDSYENPGWAFYFGWRVEIGGVE